MSRKFAHVLGWIGITLGAACSAQADELSLQITPIVGFERVVRSDPEPYAKWRVVYGAGVIAGYRILSGELEATRGTDSETFPLQGIEDRYQEDRLKLGVRTEVDLSSLLAAYFRLGGQASRGKRERTEAGSTTTTWTPIKADPYLGAGLRIQAGSALQLQAGLTVVFRRFPHMEDNEYQTSFGVNIQLGSAGR